MNQNQFFVFPEIKKNIFRARKTLSITLKMPYIDTSNQKTLSSKIKPGVEIIRTSSVCRNKKNDYFYNKFQPNALRQTTMDFSIDNSHGLTPYYFSPIKAKKLMLCRKFKKIKINPTIPELKIKGGEKKTNEDFFDKNMFDYLNNFYTNVNNKYCLVYNDIDRLQKGFIVLDDLIDFFIMKDIENKNKNYDIIKVLAKTLYKALLLVSNKKKVYKKHFFSLCSVYEHNNSEVLDFQDKKTIEAIEEQILELKDFFLCFTDNETIELKNVLSEIALKDKITKSRLFVNSEKIDFCRFLRCSPFFVWIYNTINNMT